MDSTSFENLSFLQKIQLYLLVPMVFWLLLFIFENYIKQSLINQNSKLPMSMNIVKISTQKIDQLVINTAIGFIEEKSKQYQLTTQSISLQEKTILLEFAGAYKNILEFLQKIKFHFQILSFEVIKHKETTSLHINIKNEYFLNKGLMDKEFYSNINKINLAMLTQIKLEAIIDEEIFIDGEWYKKGEKYLQYKIIDIEKKYIKLLDIQSKQIVKVELENESL